MQQLFSFSFSDNSSTDAITPILKKLPELDARIEKAAPEWPLTKVSKIDLAILRLAVWELVYEGTEPPKVIIDEAVELAKAYGNEHSAKFINGALGSIVERVNVSSIKYQESKKS